MNKRQKQFLQQTLLIEHENNISNTIHSTAIIHESAIIGKNVKIGPYSILEDNVIIKNNCVIGNHVTICSNTLIGEGCNIFHCSSIGEIPQDLKFEGENSRTIIGDNTIIREYVTINRGTKALGKTKIGSSCLLMASTHIAHDCIVGDNVIMSNLSTLGGHVTLEDWVVLGGGVLVHQFTKVGQHAFVGGGFRVTQDVPPYILAAENPLTYKGINSIGLKRRGFSLEKRTEIKKIYQTYFQSGINRKKSIGIVQSELPSTNIKNTIIDFILSSQRGII